MNLKTFLMLAVALWTGLAAGACGARAEEKPTLKKADFAATWEGQSKSKAITGFTLTLGADGKGMAKYTVVKGGKSGRDRFVNIVVSLKEIEGKFQVVLERNIWNVSMGKDRTTLTLSEEKGAETIELKKKAEK